MRPTRYSSRDGIWRRRNKYLLRTALGAQQRSINERNMHRRPTWRCRRCSKSRSRGPAGEPWQLTFFMAVALHCNDQRESCVLQSNELGFQSGGPVLVLQADLNKTNVITGQNVRCCCMSCKENPQHQAPAAAKKIGAFLNEMSRRVHFSTIPTSIPCQLTSQFSIS